MVCPAVSGQFESLPPPDSSLRIWTLQSGLANEGSEFKDLGQVGRREKLRCKPHLNRLQHLNRNTLPNNTCSGTKLYRVGVRVTQAHPVPHGAQGWGIWVTFRQETRLEEAPESSDLSLHARQGPLSSQQHRTPGGSEEYASFQTPSRHECKGVLSPTPFPHLSPSSVVLCVPLSLPGLDCPPLLGMRHFSQKLERRGPRYHRLPVPPQPASYLLVWSSLRAPAIALRACMNTLTFNVRL